MNYIASLIARQGELLMKRTLKKAGNGIYEGHGGCLIHRTVREETDDYGRAGEIEWRVYDDRGNPIDVCVSLWDARSRYGRNANS